MVMDSLIALSYAVIFIALVWIALKLRRLAGLKRYLWVFLSFGLFIVACGGTHVMDVVNLWRPEYRLATEVRLFCTLASVPTAILFVWSSRSIQRSIRSYVEMSTLTKEQLGSAENALTVAKELFLERKKAAEEVASINEQLNAVMNSTSERIIQIGYDWTILYGNRIAVETLPDFRVGGNFWECFPQLQGTDVENSLSIAMTDRKDVAFENYYGPYDIWFSNHAFPTKDGISIFFRDITSEKRLGESLERERMIREKHVEQMSHMAGGLAHEISNPLAIIHARASDLEEMTRESVPPNSAQVQKAAASIVNTADRAIQILRGLKALSRQAEADPMELADLEVVCREAIDLQASRFARHKVALRLSLGNIVSRVTCRPIQIGQVLTNLINNGFDAIEQYKPAERWVLVELENCGSDLCLRVTNSGPVIAEEIREKLMDPFFTTKKMGLGTGVGLSLSRAIANDHGGSLKLLAGTEHTTFELMLPMADR